MHYGHFSSSIASLLLVLLLTSVLPGQQQPPVQPRAPFQLNPIETAFLDQLLLSWETESGKIETYRCPFERWEYNPVFGPSMQIPFSKDLGEVSFQKPDKASFQITQVIRLENPPAGNQGQPAVPQQAKWVPQPNIVGEHYVCDGKNVYEYRHDQKQLMVRPIPLDMQGQAIVDGPLPFLFGAKAEKLKQRYWLKVQDQPDTTQIWLVAFPKFQSDKANYDQVRLSLDRASMLPRAMEMHMPDKSRQTYIFDLGKASVNAPFQKIKNLFQAPRTPFGWKRIVENNVRQASQNQPAPR